MESVDGIVRNTMINTCKILRENHAVLIRLMDVFVNEPLIEWKSYARKQAELLKNSKGKLYLLL